MFLRRQISSFCSNLVNFYTHFRCFQVLRYSSKYISYHDILWNEYSFRNNLSPLILNFECFCLPFISLSSISISQSCEFSGESFIISSVSSITGETELFWRINWFDLFINCCWSFSACIASFSDHSWHNRLISNWRKPTLNYK